MKKVIKNREDFINENYYETSSTMVPGQGVGPGLFPNAAANPTLFSTTDPKNLTEKNILQDGANGIKEDPDYVPPAQNTHAVYQGQCQLGDIVEDVDKKCKYYGTTGKVFGIMGSGNDAMIDYIVANETENYKIGEVARTSATHLKIVKKHQMNGAMNESVNESKSEERKIEKWLKKNAEKADNQDYDFTFDDAGIEFDVKIENGVVTLYDGEEETTMDPKSFIKDWMNESVNEVQLNLFSKLTPELKKELDAEYDNDFYLKDHPGKKEKFYDLLLTFARSKKYGALQKEFMKLFKINYAGTGSNMGELLEYFYNMVRKSIK